MVLRTCMGVRGPEPHQLARLASALPFHWFFQRPAEIHHRFSFGHWRALVAFRQEYGKYKLASRGNAEVSSTF
jgi:IS30 family transposase